MTSDKESARNTSSESKNIVHTSRDQDKNKGATEEAHNDQEGNSGMQNQLGHRDEDSELKDADSNLPG
jgi:hypothetical protein